MRLYLKEEYGFARLDPMPFARDTISLSLLARDTISLSLLARYTVCPCGTLANVVSKKNGALNTLGSGGNSNMSVSGV